MDHPPSSASGPSETGDRALEVLVSRLQIAKVALEQWCSSSRDQAFNVVYREWRDCRPEKVALLIQSVSDELAEAHEKAQSDLTAQAAKLEAAERLIAKWEDAAVWEFESMSNVQAGGTFDQCADELKAALSSASARPAEQKNADGLLGTAAGADAGEPAPRRDGWLPIETAPKDGTNVLVATFAPRLDSFDWDKAHWWDGNFQNRAGWWCRAELVYPTHWMPLSNLPQAEAQDAPADLSTRPAEEQP